MLDVAVGKRKSASVRMTGTGQILPLGAGWRINKQDAVINGVWVLTGEGKHGGSFFELAASLLVPAGIQAGVVWIRPEEIEGCNAIARQVECSLDSVRARCRRPTIRVPSRRSDRPLHPSG